MRVGTWLILVTLWKIWIWNFVSALQNLMLAQGPFFELLKCILLSDISHFSVILMIATGPIFPSYLTALYLGTFWEIRIQNFVSTPQKLMLAPWPIFLSYSSVFYLVRFLIFLQRRKTLKKWYILPPPSFIMWICWIKISNLIQVFSYHWLKTSVSHTNDLISYITLGCGEPLAVLAGNEIVTCMSDPPWWISGQLWRSCPSLFYFPAWWTSRWRDLAQISTPCSNFETCPKQRCRLQVLRNNPVKSKGDRRN